MAKREDDFESWLDQTTNTFRGFPSHMQNEAVKRLLEETDEESDESNARLVIVAPKRNYYLMKSITKFLLVDILSLLPNEMKEMLCFNVDGKTLLNACRVSQNWNRMISSLQKVWQVKCISNGFQEIVASDWKVKYLLGLKTLEAIESGGALAILKSPIVNLNEEPFTSFIISGGSMYASARNKVYVWSINKPLNLERMFDLGVHFRVSCMCEYKPQVLIIGDTKGFIVRSSQISAGREVEGLSFPAHDGPVTCLAVDKQRRLIASGGWDGITKLWCLCGFCFLSQTDNYVEAVSQVMFVASSDGQEFSLVASSKHSVTVYHCVIISSEEQNSCPICCFKEAIHLSTTAVDRSGNEIMRNVCQTPLHLGRERLVYTRRTAVNSSEMIVYNLSKKKEERVISLDAVYCVLAAGKVFVLLLGEDRISHYCFILYNLNKNCTSASWKYQRTLCSPCHPFKFASGNNLWLDDLGHLSQNEPLLACADTSNQVNVIFWHPIHCIMMKQNEDVGVKIIPQYTF